jgi:hypothetical protein
MPLTKLQFRPGINREVTDYTNEGGWFDCDKVRFRFGFPEKIGGWQKFSNLTFLGTCRALHPWVSLEGERYIGTGTNLKYYVNEGGGYFDITPIRETTASGDVTFSASANTLAANVSNSATEITLTSVSGFPSTGFVKINSEIILYAAVSGSQLTGCVRGQFSTTAAAHTSGNSVTCATITVNDTAHGALENDFVTFTGASSLGGAITANILNQEYQVVHVEDANTYYITARTVSTISEITISGSLNETPVFATTSDSGNGGSSVVGAYQINTGLDTTVTGTGWGAGTWGRGTWGSASSLAVQGAKLRIWSHDNFGEDLIYNVRDGDIFYWDKTNGTNTRGVALSSLAGSNYAPTIAKQVLVSDRDRHVIAFGCDSQDNPGVQDPLLIRFSDQESLTEWESTPLTTAGDLRLGSGSEIVSAVETRQQVVVFTDTSLYAMQFLGPPFTFGIQLISENTTIVGPLTAVAVDDQVFWMGRTEFYMYNGSVQRLPCSVRDYVFDDLNINQLEKITAGLNAENTEIWWFYPSSSSSENNRYVVYNYQDGSWYYGNLARTCWIDSGIEKNPVAASTDNFLYNHEIGFDDGSVSPATAITAFVESSPLDLGDGQQFTFLSRMIPDIDFRNSSAPAPIADITTNVRNYVDGTYTRTVTSEIGSSTEQVNLRLRGRQFTVKVTSDETGVGWRLGSLRYDIRPDGRR